MPFVDQDWRNTATASQSYSGNLQRPLVSWCPPPSNAMQSLSLPALGVTVVCSDRMPGKTFDDDLRGRGVSEHVIKLLVDHGVSSMNELAFLDEDDFKQLESKGLKKFQERQLKDIQKKIEPEKKGQDLRMNNNENATKNIQAGTIHTVNVSEQAMDKGDENETTFIECAERQILERLKSTLEDVEKNIKHICMEYAKLHKVTVDPHTWEQLFMIMEEKKHLKPKDVVFLQILLWNVKENKLFQLIVETADAWVRTFRLEIVFLRTDPEMQGREKVKFHLCVLSADFGEDAQVKWKSAVAFLLMVDVEQIAIENVEIGGSAWVTVIMPAVVAEALQKKCQDQAFQNDLETLHVDRITFMTNSGAEHTVCIAGLANSDPEDCTKSATTSQSDMDVPTAESGQSGAAVGPWPVHWKEDATRQLLELFHSTAATSSLGADLQPLTPAVIEAIEMALTSVERRFREYAELCAYRFQSNTELDVETTSSLLLQTETSIQFYVKEWLSVWKNQLQDCVDILIPEISEVHPDDADDFHMQALDKRFPRLVRDMRERVTSLVDDLVAHLFLSVTRADSILRKGTLKAVRGQCAQQFQTSFVKKIPPPPPFVLI